jgi:hypothetical protein
MSNLGGGGVDVEQQISNLGTLLQNMLTSTRNNSTTTHQFLDS